MKTKSGSGVTFAVDDVIPGTEPLPECRLHEAVQRAVGSRLESCSDYHGSVIQFESYQPLLAAVYTAFNNHRPLVLSPDAVWITLAQGVAQHMLAHAESLRSRFVAYQGKLTLTCEVDGWVEGSPENPWPQAFALWTEKIRDHVGSATHDLLICDFTTSGPLERTVSQIVMMDIFERYFHYDLYGICGIPTITLEGTPDDWQRLADKAARLCIFDMDWWLTHLLPICGEFVRASQGVVDLAFWQSICKLREEYGGNVINGWVARLFPYLRAFINGPCTRRNPIFETGEGFQTFFAPSGLSQVPFTWRNSSSPRKRFMEAVGGLVGVEQNPDTLALRPKVGWAVREASAIAGHLDRVTAEHTTHPGVRFGKEYVSFPTDLAAFYHATNGAELFGRGETAVFRLVPSEEVEPLDFGEPTDRFGIPGRSWHRIAWLADRTWLAINLDPLRGRSPAGSQAVRSVDSGLFSPICCGSGNQGRPGENPVIALSFSELLERLLESGGRPYWQDPQFKAYGDSKAYTRS